MSQRSWRPYPIRAWTAVFFGQRFFYVQFNESIVPFANGSIGNWTWVWNGFFWVPNNVQGALDTVKLRPVQGNPMPGPDRIKYFADPEDVLAASDSSPAPEFVDYPIT